MMPSHRNRHSVARGRRLRRVIYPRINTVAGMRSFPHDLKDTPPCHRDSQEKSPSSRSATTAVVGRSERSKNPRERRRPGTVITPGYKTELGLNDDQIEPIKAQAAATTVPVVAHVLPE
jgi:hypothetical protein